MPQVMEGVIGSAGSRIWGKIHMRSVRLGGERFTLILIEDLTAEKKQAALSRKYTASLREAHDELEKKVSERTADLINANEKLRREVAVRRRAQKTLNLAAKVISSCNEAILVTDARANIVHVNQAFCKITGFSSQEVIGKNPNFMASDRHEREFWREFWNSIQTTGQWRGEVWDRRKNGEVFPKLLAVSAIRDENGDVSHYVGIFSDITRIKQTEERLESLAHYDPLTQLPNRLLLRDRMTQALFRAQEEHKLLALMYIDLDGFKDINDTLGHPKGDELLVRVAERLSGCARESDTVARLGGDEFTVLMPDIAEVRHIIPVAHRIIKALSRPFRLSNGEIFTSASMGISVYPYNGQDADTLLQHADNAMYHAKSQGKNNFQFFCNTMNNELTRVVGMELTLRRAIQSNGLLVHYQPVVDARTGRVMSMEALLRIRDTKGQVVSAGPYISVSEEKGLIVPIGEGVLRTACKQNMFWQDAGYPCLRMAVNVSMRQLQEHNVVGRFLSVMEETEHDPRYLELELTESAIMKNPKTVTAMLNEFRRHGVSITIDDFGTGYSSLSRLKDLPVDKLKIDRSFLRGITSDPSQKALIKAVVTAAHNFNITVVAEGVESREQMEVLCELDCDALQGYYFSPAIPAEDFHCLPEALIFPIGKRM